MSYILDALKKSERERRRSSMDGPPTINDSASDMPGRRPLWPYLVVGVLALSIGIFASWAGISYLKKPSVVAGVASSNTREPKVRDAVTFASTAGDESVSSGEDRNEERSATAPSVESDESVVPAGKHVDESKSSVVDTGLSGKKTGNRQEQSGTGPRKSGSDLKVKGSDKNGVRANPSAVRKKTHAEYVTPLAKPDIESELPPPDPNRLYKLGELPRSVRGGLPAFSVSVFLYSDEVATRVVKINGRMLKEGQDLADGLKLDEIVPDGMIFTYHKYRFHVGLK